MVGAIRCRGWRTTATIGFFTQTKRLWKFPISHDIGDKVTEARPSQGILAARMPKELVGYDHFGDLDQANGLLYIPTEGGGTGEDNPLFIFDGRQKQPSRAKAGSHPIPA